jgi:hypothetical protein
MIFEIKNDVKTLEFKFFTHGTLGKVIEEWLLSEIEFRYGI